MGKARGTITHFSSQGRSRGGGKLHEGSKEKAKGKSTWSGGTTEKGFKAGSVKWIQRGIPLGKVRNPYSRKIPRSALTKSSFFETVNGEVGKE